MFYPFQEIYVKTEGEVLTVSAKQETRGSRREFQQMFTIPAGVKVDKLSSALADAAAGEESEEAAVSRPRSLAERVPCLGILLVLLGVTVFQAGSVVAKKMTLHPVMMLLTRD